MMTCTKPKILHSFNKVISYFKIDKIISIPYHVMSKSVHSTAQLIYRWCSSCKNVKTFI